MPAIPVILQGFPEEEIDSAFDSISFDRQNPDEVRILTLAEAAKLEAQDTSNTIESGYPELDDCMDGGFREGDFTIVSGIPGDGKTTFCRTLTMNFAEEKIPSLWFSHEMSIRELWDSFEKMGAPEDMISYVPTTLQEDMDWMFEMIKRAIKQNGTKVVFIDTLGDIVKSVKEQKELGNYATYLAQMCKDLRKFAIDNKIMIVAVAHAIKQTRSGSNETNNSDIANSNGIPAAATNIFHVWRDKDSDFGGFIKIGKSRRDGSKKNWKFETQLVRNQLLVKGRHLGDPLEDDFRKA